MLWEKKLDNWAENIRTQLRLPLRVDLWNGHCIELSHARPEVIIKIPNIAALRYLFTPSLLSLGKAYIDGKIEIEGKINEIITVGNALASHLLKTQKRFSPFKYFSHHSKLDDAQAIHYHYDVSNDFYRLWLDKNMVYSCAYFENGNEDLATAQIKKIDHILNKIKVQPGDSLLDIGCGWGALVIRAAQKYGAKCTGITLSENQAALAKECVTKAGLDHLIEIRLQDYRDVTGLYNRITSIGMYEHVGLKNLPLYFHKIQSLLTSDGLAMNHGITSVNTDGSDTPHGCGEFIDQYVFPHGELPHIGLTLQAMQEGGLEVLDVENLRRHYVKTCSIWADNFETKTDEIKRIAGDKRFRIWRLYLAGCAHAFEQDWISLFQVVCTKSGQLAFSLPWSRQYMYR